ncbi:THUMP domain-containing class I SAM-dependent RNA methyltransferase [Puniceibacterium sediminis]|uniref:Putative N6-adenine-specific DNA methylase n=1 Tax=Puniceibacterium sediminis TaxID=1608407 RepID=A0A238XD68_9RHOB|nr:RNA methyltransferase [Puniceibacterium sediminis]SNR56528.1 putative N6-adenine-specific DNA methylase [Puniceibacterium sediminis]
MNTDASFEIFLVAPPGLESLLCAEALEKGFTGATVTPGGVTLTGGWPDVWRANLTLRGASRVLARIGSIRVMHLAQLDKRARKFPWADTLRPDVPIRVDVTCKASRIYHAGAATQRIETALKESLGATIAADAPLRLMARIEDDLCTFSLDTSGEPLHKRGHKEAVGKAPMRETLASLFLRQCGYTGDEPLVDPMCGSGTFVIEAAEIAKGLNPGRSRSFAFDQFASFDADLWQQMRRAAPPVTTTCHYYGSDRDTGAIRMSTANAERAGVGDITTFRHAAVSDLIRPEGPPGLVMVNPPYGTRIGEKKLLFAVYGALGKTLLERFSGWRVGMVTTDLGLAKASALPFAPPMAPVSHGGLRIHLLQTGALR